MKRRKTEKYHNALLIGSYKFSFDDDADFKAKSQLSHIDAESYLNPHNFIPDW